MTLYTVMSIPHVTDGDTLWIRRLRRVGRMHGMAASVDRTIGEVDGVELVAMRRGGVAFGGMDLYERDYEGGTRVRLHDGKLGLQCPEKNTNRLGWNTARQDLLTWVALWEGLQPLRLQTFGRDKYGRLLGDLQPLDQDPTYSAVFWMRDKGWEAYTR